MATTLGVLVACGCSAREVDPGEGPGKTDPSSGEDNYFEGGGKFGATDEFADVSRYILVAPLADLDSNESLLCLYETRWVDGTLQTYGDLRAALEGGSLGWEPMYPNHAFQLEALVKAAGTEANFSRSTGLKAEALGYILGIGGALAGKFSFGASWGFYKIWQLTEKEMNGDLGVLKSELKSVSTEAELMNEQVPRMRSHSIERFVVRLNHVRESAEGVVGQERICAALPQQ